jgi:hypothetical protein
MGDSAELHLRRGRLLAKYPALASGHFRITSPRDSSYNCLAFAADETRRCWPPSAFGGLHWPAGAVAEDTLDGWISAYGTLGYTVSASAELESEWEKIAIYADRDFPLHVARQLPTGLWTSKLGPQEDIEHELAGLQGEEYGRVAVVLARPRE